MGAWAVGRRDLFVCRSCASVSKIIRERKVITDHFALSFVSPFDEFFRQPFEHRLHTGVDLTVQRLDSAAASGNEWVGDEG